MKRNYKSLLSIALVLLLVAITSLTFAFWDQLTDTENDQITLGEGQTVVVDDVTPSTLKLIPNGAILVEGQDTYEIEVIYTVKLKKVNVADKIETKLTALTVGGDAAVAAQHITVKVNDQVKAINGVTDTTFTNASVLDYNVSVKFAFTQNNTYNFTAEEYAALANKVIAYTLTFTYVKAA